MGLFNWSYTPKETEILEQSYDQMSRESELNRMVEEKAIKLYHCSKDEWNEFKQWQSMSFIERIISKVNLRTPTSEPFLLAIAWTKEEIKANLSGSKSRSGNEMKERLLSNLNKAKTPFTTKQLASLIKDLFLFNVSLKKDESAYEFMLGKFIDELAYDNSNITVPAKSKWQKRNKKAKRNESIKHHDYSIFNNTSLSNDLYTNGIDPYNTTPKA